MIRLTTSNPPIFGFEVTQADKTTAITVHAEWYSDDDESRDRVQTSLKRYHEARNLNYWLSWFDYRLLSVTNADTFVEFAKSLPGKGPAIYLYLKANPKGVTFSEFKAFRDPVTGNPLTDSDDNQSIAAMVRKLSSQELVRNGERIACMPSKNLIILESLKNKSKV